MATFTFTGSIFNTPEWGAIPDLRFALGETVDIDLYEYLDADFDAVITRKVGADQFPPDLMIVQGRYLRGESTELTDMRQLQLVATRYGVSVDSSTFGITIETTIISSAEPLWTDGRGNALWTDGRGNALWTR